MQGYFCVSTYPKAGFSDPETLDPPSSILETWFITAGWLPELLLKTASVTSSGQAAKEPCNRAHQGGAGNMKYWKLLYIALEATVSLVLAPYWLRLLHVSFRLSCPRVTCVGTASEGAL